MTRLCIPSIKVSHSLMETGTLVAFSLRKKPVNMFRADTKGYPPSVALPLGSALDGHGGRQLGAECSAGFWSKESTMRPKALAFAAAGLLAVAVPAASWAGGPHVGVTIGIGVPVFPPPAVVYYPPSPVVYYPRVYYPPVHYSPPTVVFRAGGHHGWHHGRRHGDWHGGHHGHRVHHGHHVRHGHHGRHWR